MQKPSNFLASVFGGDKKRAREFCKKLLGQIVFLYFLQKKGWLGASTGDYKKADGDKNFLQKLYEQAGSDETFYPLWLSKLFYETLNKKRDNDDFTMPNGSTVKIPYLNGGLFEKESKKFDSLVFPKELFSDLFDFFNQYNFTIYENSPEEHTVAVDPEMLGHIFENLLEDNKDKGAFYTPKEIVRYMTQESLIAYLVTHLGSESKDDVDKFVKEKDKENLTDEQLKKIDDLLGKVKICDPAIGSGAFPMGLLQEIFALKEQIAYDSGFRIWSPARVKEDIISKSIYGVDTEKGAVDIAQLRFWLSLIIDEDTPKALPNLDYKIVVGNSLVSKFENKARKIDEVLKINWETKNFNVAAADKHKDATHEALLKISEKQKEYFSGKSSGDKKQLKSEIRELKLNVLYNQLSFNKIAYLNANVKIPDMGLGMKPKDRKKNLEIDLRVADFENAISKINKLIEKPDEDFNHFDWRLDFPEILNPIINKDKKTRGFDIVIGNPPYIQLQKMRDEATKFKNENYETFARTGDIYCLFYEKGQQLLKQGGNLCFITSNKWMRAGYGKALRHFLVDNTTPQILIDMGPGVFQSATVDTNILLLTKNPPPKNHRLKALTLKASSDKNKMSLASHFDKKHINIPLPAKDAAWTILSPIEQAIKQKIEAKGTPLKQWDIQINYGIKTGYNDAFIIDNEKRDALLAACQNADEKERTKALIKPILRGRDIKQYQAKWAGLWVIATFPALHLKIDDYPAVKNYLKSFGKRLHQTGEIFFDKEGLKQKSRKKTGNQWFETQDQIAYYQEFAKEKIVWNRISKELVFSYAEGAKFILDSMFFFTGKNIKLLLALANSKVSKFWIKRQSASLGEGVYGAKIYIENLPIPELSKQEQKPFIQLVEEILASKAKGQDTTTQEQQIDERVFELYGLSEKEIKYISDGC